MTDYVEKGTKAYLTDQYGNPISMLPASSGQLAASTANTNATSVSTKATTLLGVQGYNAAAYVVFLKIFDKASAPTVGTDTPVKNLAIPAGAAFVLDLPFLLKNGLAFALTKGAALLDSTAVAANDVVGLNLDYN